MDPQTEVETEGGGVLKYVVVLLVFGALGFSLHKLYRQFVPGRLVLYPPDRMPVPPQQWEEWEPPPNDLPEEFAEATELLFIQGMADPRGCEYREIAVVAGSAMTAGRGLVSTHGWVLPAVEGEEQRYAVCWNGHLYPVSSVGAEANLERDVRALLPREPTVTAGTGQDLVMQLGFWGGQEEATAVRHDVLNPLKPCLLLRAGKGELATKLWRRWRGAVRSLREMEKRDIYVLLAREWTWSLLSRALCAHMTGDDETALLTARALLKLRGAIAQRVHLRGREGEEAVDFLWQVHDLVQDQERRAARARRRRSKEVGALSARDAEERVEALIRSLDEIHVRRRTEPGSMPWAQSPTFVALVMEGAAAVEPLLECLEHDDRLTRTVQANFASNPRQRTVLGVADPACHALNRILRKQFFYQSMSNRNLTREGKKERREVAAWIRDHVRRKPIALALPPQPPEAAAKARQPAGTPTISPDGLANYGSRAFSLLEAACEGDDAKVRELVESRGEPGLAEYKIAVHSARMLPDWEALDVLMLHAPGKSILPATVRGDAETVRVRLAEGLPTRNAWEVSCALPEAVRRGHAEVVQYLLEASGGTQRIAVEPEDLLAVALAHGHGEVVEVLVARGPRISDEAISIASRDPEMARALIEADGVLQAALDSRQFEFARTVLEQNPDILSGEEPPAPGLLHAAVRAAHTELVRKLLSAGADPTGRDERGLTALHYCTEHPAHTRLARILLEHGAEPNAADPRGCTPLHYAAEHGNATAVGLLFEYGADRQLRTKEGDTARELAAEHGHAETAELLR